MAKETPAQQTKVGRVMHAFKEGKLNSSSGDRVTNPRQAVAIGLSTAGASDRRPARKQGPE